MFRIIISFIILISLTMSSAVGLVGLDTYHFSENTIAVALDKPDNVSLVMPVTASIEDQSEREQSDAAEAEEKQTINVFVKKETSRPLPTVISENNTNTVENKTETSTQFLDKPSDNTQSADKQVSDTIPAGSANSTNSQQQVKGVKEDDYRDKAPTGKASTGKESKDKASNGEASKDETSKKEAVNTVSATKQPAEQSTQSSTKEESPSEYKTIDLSQASKGLIGIRYQNQVGKKMKLMIEKDGTRYTYNLLADNTLESFSLQSGSGDYKISIMENTDGNKYKYVLTETINISMGSKLDAYLNSIQMINWKTDMAAIKKAKDLTVEQTSDKAKVEKIYNYIVNNVNYDYSKLGTLPSTYLPVIDDTLASKFGICYDFASLNAAMLRSLGIPAKLVMGYAEGVTGYHAWNEVYLEGKWIVIDISYDSQMREAGGDYTMIKKTASYTKEKEY